MVSINSRRKLFLHLKIKIENIVKNFLRSHTPHMTHGYWLVLSLLVIFIGIGW